MSKVGNLPIPIPDQVSVKLEGSTATIKGPKGELSHTVPKVIKLKKDREELKVLLPKPTRQTRPLHGLSRSLLNNMVIGVTQGYEKRLELVGTGYRAALLGDTLSLNLGFSHPIELAVPEGISFKVKGNNKIVVSGIDKQQVGQVAAEIRSFKKPEPYKGKGIRFENEVVRRKPGKAAKVGAAGGEEQS